MATRETPADAITRLVDDPPGDLAERRRLGMIVLTALLRRRPRRDVERRDERGKRQHTNPDHAEVAESGRDSPCAHCGDRPRREADPFCSPECAGAVGPGVGGDGPPPPDPERVARMEARANVAQSAMLIGLSREERAEMRRVNAIGAKLGRPAVVAASLASVKKWGRSTLPDQELDSDLARVEDITLIDCGLAWEDPAKARPGPHGDDRDPALSLTREGEALLALTSAPVVEADPVEAYRSNPHAICDACRRTYDSHPTAIVPVRGCTEHILCDGSRVVFGDR